MFRRLLSAGVAIAILAAGAVWLALRDRSPEPAGRPAVAAPSEATIKVIVRPQEPETEPPRGATVSAPTVTVAPSEPLSQTDIELIALEEQAQRRIDVVPLLEGAGIDLKTLQERPDGQDVLRHIAADELLTRGYMREYFSTVTYPHGYPIESAERDARAHAESMIAQLVGNARVESLEQELEADSADLPEPTVYSEDSGRVYQDPSLGEEKTDGDRSARR